MALRKSTLIEDTSNRKSSFNYPTVVGNENTSVPVNEGVPDLVSEQVPTLAIDQSKNTTSWMEAYEEIKPSKMGTNTEGALSMVNSKNGKRIKINKSVIEEMGSPYYVRFLINEAKQEVHIISGETHVNAHTLTGKKSKNMLYSASLVNRLTLLFGLDYTTCTSQTFGTWTVSVREGTKVITVRLEQ